MSTEGIPARESDELSAQENEERAAAREILMNDEYLRSDAYAQRVVERGVADSGVQVNLKEFLNGRRAFIEQQVAGVRLSRINPETVQIVSTVRPDIEKYLED